MRRNAILPKIFVILPVVMLLIVPYAANQEVKNLTFCVVDNDHSTLSRRLVEQVAASEYFNLTAVTADYASAMAYVEATSGFSIFLVKRASSLYRKPSGSPASRSCRIA